MVKQAVEKRDPSGFLDYLSLVITTNGVGYLPLAPGTYGSLLAVGLYWFLATTFRSFRYTASLESPEFFVALIHSIILIALLLYILAGIWAANRSIGLLGNTDAPEAVVDEVIGQLIVFLFIPFTTSWVLIGTGFLLFRLFDIWKPYPIDYLQELPGGIGVCADDMLAGVYAGVCLSVFYAISLYL